MTDDMIRLSRGIDELADPKFRGTNMTPIGDIENAVRARLGELRTKIAPMARRAYIAARDVITAPDHEEPRPNKAVLARMIEWFAAEDRDED